MGYVRHDPGRHRGIHVPVDVPQIARIAYGHKRVEQVTTDELKSVQRALRALERRGLVERDKPWRSGQRSTWRPTAEGKRWEPYDE